MLQSNFVEKLEQASLKNNGDYSDVLGRTPDRIRHYGNNSFYFYSREEGGTERDIFIETKLEDGNNLYTYYPIEAQQDPHWRIRRKQLHEDLDKTQDEKHILGEGAFGVATLMETTDEDGSPTYRYVLKTSKYDQVRRRTVNSVDILIAEDTFLVGTLAKFAFKDISMCPLLITQRIVALNNKGMQFPEQYGFSILLNEEKNAIMIWESMEYIEGLNVREFISFIMRNVLPTTSQTEKFEGYLRELMREFPNLSKEEISEILYLQTLAYNEKVRLIDPDLIDLRPRNTIVTGHTKDDKGNLIFKLRGIDPIVVEHSFLSKAFYELFYELPSLFLNKV